MFVVQYVFLRARGRVCSSYRTDVALSKENSFIHALSLVLRHCTSVCCDALIIHIFSLRCVYRETVVFTGLVVWPWCLRPLQRVGVFYYGSRGFKRESKVLFGNIVCSSFR